MRVCLSCSKQIHYPLLLTKVEDDLDEGDDELFEKTARLLDQIRLGCKKLRSILWSFFP